MPMNVVMAGSPVRYSEPPHICRKTASALCMPTTHLVHSIFGHMIPAISLFCACLSDQKVLIRVVAIFDLVVLLHALHPLQSLKGRALSVPLEAECPHPAIATPPQLAISGKASGLTHKAAVQALAANTTTCLQACWTRVPTFF